MILQNIDAKITLEVFGEVSIYYGMGIQIVFALILGGIVGFDREVKLKAAGLKTNIMILIRLINSNELYPLNFGLGVTRTHNL